MSPAFANPPQPDQIVRIAAADVIQELGSHGQDFDRNPDELYRLVETRLAPHFDFESISEVALGRFRGQATPEQFDRFRTAFSKTLLRSYSGAMRGYRNERIDWQPARIGADGSEAIVGFVLKRNDGSPPIPVSFRMHYRNDQWMVYDVAIENIGLVSTYRSSFSQELKRNGIDGLTARLESKLAD
ncbi:MAG: MlaC/ttg2D family ABC transporter substrate-binding protein [Nevskiales bacterium]